MANWNSLYFMDAGSTMMQEMMFFHDYAMVIVVFILSLVLYILFMTCSNYLFNLSIVKHHLLETIWSLMPIVLLLFVAFPSLSILYRMEEVYSPLVSVKCIGHQWYWSYEYSNWENLDFNSYMKSAEESTFRLLEVDQKMVLPYKQDARLLISSLDVIHSWAVPSLGLKVDAVPGRINQIFVYPKRYGLFFGQCSEICGANHTFMPICVLVTKLENYQSWVNNF